MTGYWDAEWCGLEHPGRQCAGMLWWVPLRKWLINRCLSVTFFVCTWDLAPCPAPELKKRASRVVEHAARQLRRKLVVMRSAHVQRCRVGINRPTACRLAVNVSRRPSRIAFDQMCPAEARVQCCFTFTETVRLMRDVKPRTATSTFTQLPCSDICQE